MCPTIRSSKPRVNSMKLFPWGQEKSEAADALANIAVKITKESMLPSSASRAEVEVV